MAGTKAIYRRHGFEEIIDIFLIYLVFFIFFMKKSLVLSFALVAFLFTGCANNMHTVKISNTADFAGDYNKRADSEWNHFFLYGLFQNSNTDAASMCPSGKKPSRIVTETRWYQSLIGFVTFGIYVPRQTSVWCE